MERKKLSPDGRHWKSQFSILLIGLISIVAIMGIFLVAQQLRFENHKTASTELLTTGIELLSTCLELSEISMEKVQSVWLDEKFEELKQELKENE